MSNRAFATLAALLVSTWAFAGEHRWKEVPGHPNLLVDLNSIRALPPIQSRTGVLPAPEDTQVDIRLNGYRSSMLLACFPPPGVRMSQAESTVINVDARGEHFIGYVPDRAVMAIVCKRKGRQTKTPAPAG